MAFGKGEAGELGLGKNLSDHVLPTHVDCKDFGGLKIVSVACGNAFSAVVVGGRVFTWGKNDKRQVQQSAMHSLLGELGHPHTNPVLEPTVVECLEEHTFVQVSCGASHMLALTGEQLHLLPFMH